MSMVPSGIVESGGGLRWRCFAALASSPAAAAATLRNRAATADGQTEEEIEELGTRAILDQEELEISEVFDATPGADPSDEESSEVSRRLRRFAREAEELRGEKDAKLQKAIRLVKGLIREGHNPILFCRFIDTADYLAAALRHAIPSVAVESVTGLLPPKDREDRISALGEKEQRILVCTDCLSEGINLQDHFDAVLHYDLSWNPTRHEQREGRVDRFGQPKPKVRILTYFGVDNQIDGIVLDVSASKAQDHQEPRSASASRFRAAAKTSSRRSSRGCSFACPPEGGRKFSSTCQDWIRFGRSFMPGGMRPRIAKRVHVPASPNKRSRLRRSRPSSSRFGKPSGQGRRFAGLLRRCFTWRVSRRRPSRTTILTWR